KRQGKVAGWDWRGGSPRQAVPHPVRNGRRLTDRSARRDASGRGQAADESADDRPVYGRGVVVMKVRELMTDLRGLRVADLRQRAADLEEQVFRLRLQSSMGQG